jgi:beclin
MGSVSKIEEIKVDPSNPTAAPKSTMLELFSSGDLPLGRLFMHRKLDTAMVAFLECLRQLGDFAMVHDANLKLPYKYPNAPIFEADRQNCER